METVSLPEASLFSSTPVYVSSDSSGNATYFFGLLQRPVLPDSSDRQYEVRLGEDRRLDLLAHRFYRDAKLWWVLASVNNVTDPWTEIKRGTILRIPLESRVKNR